MSVNPSAIIGHRWTEFSGDTIQRISWAVTGARAAPKWLSIHRLESAEEEFNTYGFVGFSLPRYHVLRCSGNVVQLIPPVRWSAMLMHKGVRGQFLSGCRSLAQLAGADEMLLVPESVLDDLVYRGALFDEFKRTAEQEFGPPDLDIRKFYSERQIHALRHKRIHYFLAKTADL